jgi:HEAT repeat protein
LCLFVFFVAIPAFAFDEGIDSPMYKAPDTPGPRTVAIFPTEAKQLWLKAFEREGAEAETRCRVADAVVRARQRGVAGLEVFIAPFRAAVDQPDQHPAVRLAVARALVVLEARDAAPSLLRMARAGGAEVRNVIEPALARWNYRPAREVWLERLGDPETPAWSLVLAVRGLAAVGEVRAVDRLRALVRSAFASGQLRVEAARALGALQGDGLEEDARRLVDDLTPRGVVTRLAAASLLHRHTSMQAVDLLQRLARDKEPAVAALAITRLLAIEPKFVLPVLDEILGSRDANVRSLGVDVLFRLPGAKHLRLLGDRLNDSHREVRRKARRFLHELAKKKEWRNQAIAEAMRLLGSEEWRGLEQATILLTQLDHKPAANRLVELLSSEQAEVLLTAAWGVRKLAVKETLPGVVRYLEAVVPHFLSGRGSGGQRQVSQEVLDHQLSQLNQFLGQQKPAEADKLLRRFIPRPVTESGGPESRAAAIWALGLIHEGKTDRELAGQLEGRLNAGSAIPSELPPVRRMCAITLARLGAKEALPSLRRYYGDRNPSSDAEERVKVACGWAIGKLTGETIRAPETKEVPLGDWFLKPNKVSPARQRER